MSKNLVGKKVPPSDRPIDIHVCSISPLSLSLWHLACRSQLRNNCQADFQPPPAPPLTLFLLLSFRVWHQPHLPPSLPPSSFPSSSCCRRYLNPLSFLSPLISYATLEHKTCSHCATFCVVDELESVCNCYCLTARACTDSSKGPPPSAFPNLLNLGIYRFAIPP